MLDDREPEEDATDKALSFIAAIAGVIAGVAFARCIFLWMTT